MVPIAYVDVETGSQLGELVISAENGNVVNWNRYNYVYRTFTMEHRVHSTVFAKFPRSPDPNECWAVIICDDKSVHCYGLDTGKIHVMGLGFRPIAVVPCGSQGVVFTHMNKKRTNLNIVIMEAPEVILRAVVLSSVCSPLRVDDELRSINEHFAIVWNRNAKKVRAYSVNFIPYPKISIMNGSSNGSSSSAGSSMQPPPSQPSQSVPQPPLASSLHLEQQQEKPSSQMLMDNLGSDMEDTYIGILGKAAVLSPLREWHQDSLGNVFTQSLSSADVNLVACHDTSASYMYVLCGPDLIEYEEIKHVSPVLGIYGFPGAIIVNEENAVSFAFLFSPQSGTLPIDLLDDDGEVLPRTEEVKSIKTEPTGNWVELGCDNTMHRFTLLLDMEDLITRCFDIILDIFSPWETLNWLLGYITVSSGSGDGWNAMASVLHGIVDSVPARRASQLVVCLHMLREELSIDAGQDDAYQQLNSFLAPLVSTWGKHWTSVYPQSQQSPQQQSPQQFPQHHQQKPAAAAPREEDLPCIIESPPSLFESLIYCIVPNQGGSQAAEFVMKQHLFPSASILIGLFQLSATYNSSNRISEYIHQHRIAQNLDMLVPGLRTCLLEICSYIGIDTKELESGDTVLNQTRGHSLASALFRSDLRYMECRRLLQVQEPQKCLFGVYFNAEQVPDNETGAIQEIWGTALADRALASAFGKAAIEMSSRRPMLWEQMDPIEINFEGECTETGLSIPPQYKTLQAASAGKPWGVFAHGVALGLSVCPNSPGIDSLWVSSSAKLNEANSELYSGFVYGMGLCGHLASLEDWQFYESLVNSNTSGTLAALLGVSASKKGSRDAKLTKVLSVHIRALLPEGAYSSQLVPPEVEQAALISLGLLYLNQGVRHLTEVLLRELCTLASKTAGHTPSELQAVYNRSTKRPRDVTTIIDGEGSEESDSHKMAVGITLGLINCGRGDKSGLQSVLLPQVAGYHDRSVDAAEIESGALCALLLAYTGTNDRSVAMQIQLPQTLYSISYSSPPTIFSRALAHYMILWDEIEPSRTWVEAQIPQALKKTTDTKPSAGQDSMNSDMSQLYYYYALTGILVAVGMRYCGTGDEQAIDTLLYYAENVIEKQYCEVVTRLKEKKVKSGVGYQYDYNDTHLAKGFAHLLSALSLAMAIVAAGTGNLKVLRLLRELYQIGPQFQASLASDLDYTPGIDISLSQISQAIGWLFLADGTHSFKTDCQSVSMLTCFSFLPLMGSTNINFEKWQHLGFFWALVTEKRCLYVQGSPEESARVDIYLKNGEVKHCSTPLLLPPLPSISHVKVVDDNYMPQDIHGADQLISGLKLVARKTTSGTLQAMLERDNEEIHTQERAWDDSSTDMLKATLQTMAKTPTSLTHTWDINLLLTFYKVWPVSDENRILKRRDVEQLRFLQWQQNFRESNLST